MTEKWLNFLEEFAGKQVFVEDENEDWWGGTKVGWSIPWLYDIVDAPGYMYTHMSMFEIKVWIYAYEYGLAPVCDKLSYDSKVLFNDNKEKQIYKCHSSNAKTP